MKTYPIFALISGQPCLVVGGGAVGERKVQDLKEAGARVTVVSRDLTPTLADLAARGDIHVIQGDFSPACLNGMALVVGATDAPEVNARVSAEAKARGILVNIVDAPELCTFIVPATVCRGSLTLAISTGGASPALARRLRQELQEYFGPEYEAYLDLLQAVRDKVLENRRGHPENAALFHRLVASPLRQAVAEADREKIFQILRKNLGEYLSAETLQELTTQALKEK